MDATPKITAQHVGFQSFIDTCRQNKAESELEHESIGESEMPPDKRIGPRVSDL